MKAILLIALLTICSCETPIEVVKCFLQSDIIFKGIASLIDVIQTKNIVEIIKVITGLYGPFYDEVKKCLAMTEEEILFGLPGWLQNLIRIIGPAVEAVWKNGGCSAVKKYCKKQLGIFAVACMAIKC